MNIVDIRVLREFISLTFIDFNRINIEKGIQHSVCAKCQVHVEEIKGSVE